MGNGYQIKIDNIVDNIVDGNIEFNKKTVYEQNVAKFDMIKVINDSISEFDLNSFGQQLVLDELNSRASLGLIEIFGSNGNINTVELIKVTDTVIKKTIEEAEKNGTNVKKSTSEKETSNKDESFEKSDIGKRIDDYTNLSTKEKNDLWNNYSNMSREQQRRLENENIRGWENLGENSENPDIKEKCSNIAKCNKNFQKARDSKDPRDKARYMGIILGDKKFKKHYEETTGKEMPKEYTEELFSQYGEYRYGQDPNKQAFMELYDGQGKIEEMTKLIPSEFKAKHSGFSERDIIQLYYSYLDYREARENDYFENLDDPEFIDFLKQNDIKDDIPVLDDTLIELMSKFNNKKKIFDFEENFERVVGGLQKANFSTEDIQTALVTYKNYIESYSNAPSEIVGEIKKLQIEDITTNIKDDFNVLLETREIDANVYRILDIIAEQNFNGKIREILLDSDSRETFLQDLEKSIESIVAEKQENSPIKDYEVNSYVQHKKESINFEDLFINDIEEQETQNIAEEQVWDNTEESDIFRIGDDSQNGTSSYVEESELIGSLSVEEIDFSNETIEEIADEFNENVIEETDTKSAEMTVTIVDVINIVKTYVSGKELKDSNKTITELNSSIKGQKEPIGVDIGK